jgi:predicted HicB family RNase H-like nuclease|nr:Queuine tRNA-ribosyltransferase [uncultured bacterium]
MYIVTSVLIRVQYQTKEAIQMALTEAQKRANAKYVKKAYEDIRLRVKTGEKAKIEARAKETGQSLNGYINGLIKKDMAGSGGE